MRLTPQFRKDVENERLIEKMALEELINKKLQETQEEE
jgi:hypothetical protein